MQNERILVVGTTPDYIEIICRRFPGRAFFLTDHRERAVSRGFCRPDEATELLYELACPEKALTALREHLDKWQIELRGITCFDCESLGLAAYIAEAFSLPFASPQAVAASRNKFASKHLWRNAKLPCPNVQLVHSPSDAVHFMDIVNRPAVLKPLTGSGSEFVFLCRNEQDCRYAFHTLQDRLSAHPNTRMYELWVSEGEKIDPRQVFVIEEFIEGVEYSCDFALDGERLNIIRIARKIPARDQTTGTVLAYILPTELPLDFDLVRFRSQLGAAARTLGLQRAICMLDFIIEEGEAMMIEMTPRPGGDCLPALERLSSGFDILEYALGFAEGWLAEVPDSTCWQRLVGLHLLAKRPGIIRMIDTQSLRKDPRVLECYLKHGPGHCVLLPPEDYDSRRLGHAIFKPSSSENIEEECLDLADKVKIEMETSS